VSRCALRLIVGFTVLVLAGWAAGEVWLSIDGSADREVTQQVLSARTQALTTAARAITWAGSSWLLVPLAAICCWALLRRGMPFPAAATAISLAGAILLCQLVKLLVSRPRPPVEHLQAVSSSSFPSGHATQASAFWLSLVLVLHAAHAPRAARRTAEVLAPLIVLAVAASRVYLGVHYASDVIAGMLLGAGWTAFTWHVLRVPDTRAAAESKGS
jgi:membrane-associated phospholipid phosphatase